MIILIFFAPFFIAIIWLVYIDSSNTKQIEEFLNAKQCEQVIYYKSRYKALCKDGVLAVKNQFSIDFTSNEVLNYNEINDVKLENNQLNIIGKSKEIRLYFEKEQQAQAFKQGLKDKQQ